MFELESFHDYINVNYEGTYVEKISDDIREFLDVVNKPIPCLRGEDFYKWVKYQVKLDNPMGVIEDKINNLLIFLTFCINCGFIQKNFIKEAVVQQEQRKRLISTVTSLQSYVEWKQLKSEV